MQTEINGMSIEDFIHRAKLGLADPACHLEDIMNCLQAVANYDELTEKIEELTEENGNLQAAKEENEAFVQQCTSILDRPDSQQTDTQALTEISKLLYAQQDLNEKDRKRGK